jgi:hypothetical protein
MFLMGIYRRIKKHFTACRPVALKQLIHASIASFFADTHLTKTKPAPNQKRKSTRSIVWYDNFLFRAFLNLPAR